MIYDDIRRNRTERKQDSEIKWKERKETGFRKDDSSETERK
jgi:hypothetical protein